MSVNPVLSPLTATDEAALRSVLRYGDGPDDAADEIERLREVIGIWITKASELDVKNKKLVALLRRIEWLSPVFGFRRCPACDGIDPGSADGLPCLPVGHEADCELAAFLAEGAAR